jgi:uncharacterized protein (DUF736 family)
MIIGHFTYEERTDTYRGEIETFTLHRREVSIQPSGMNGERDPAYRIVVANEGGEIELGAAWRKSSERGADYLSIVLDDPAFPKRCDAALFTDAGERTAKLVWQRPKDRPQLTASPSDRPAARNPRGRAAAPKP